MKPIDNLNRLGKMLLDNVPNPMSTVGNKDQFRCQIGSAGKGACPHQVAKGTRRRGIGVREFPVKEGTKRGIVGNKKKERVEDE